MSDTALPVVAVSLLHDCHRSWRRRRRRQRRGQRQRQRHRRSQHRAASGQCDDLAWSPLRWPRRVSLRVRHDCSGSRRWGRARRDCERHCAQWWDWPQRRPRGMNERGEEVLTGEAGCGEPDPDMTSPGAVLHHGRHRVWRRSVGAMTKLNLRRIPMQHVLHM
jgi:hypothetical protein